MAGRFNQTEALPENLNGMQQVRPGENYRRSDLLQAGQKYQRLTPGNDSRASAGLPNWPDHRARFNPAGCPGGLLVESDLLQADLSEAKQRHRLT